MPRLHPVALARWTALPLMLAASCLVAAQDTSSKPSGRSIVIERPDHTTMPLGDEALADLPREEVTAQDRDVPTRYSGIELGQLLKAAGLAPLQNVRGALLKRVLVVRGADGYAAVFSLAEFDPTIGGKRALLVDRVSGASLPPTVGPWRFVVTGDGHPTRWVRQVSRLSVVDLD